ncbi:MAG: ketoacyl-ACP synthase III [Acidimicrobiales bacterium]|nr:ketoacyl-ACP synthase III [Acidimicrobiales bacterium]MDG1877412.1 ketoacyl-ACP synthase III [Acidimicrobiales bacterium]
MTQRRAQITGWGKCVPPVKLTNADLEEMVDTSDQWIVERTGMKERGISHVEVTDLAEVAAKHALAAAGLEPTDIDLLVMATVTPEITCPSNACFLQERLGLVNAAAFDLNAACSGFVYSTATVSSMIESGVAERVLVIGAEKLHFVMDYWDRNQCILFGDGAGAAVFEATTDGSGVLAHDIGADGVAGRSMVFPTFGSRGELDRQRDPAVDRLHFEGQNVFKHAVRGMAASVERTLAKLGLTADDVDLVIPHQANRRIIEATTNRLGIPDDKVMLNIETHGNTSAASIPMALHDALAQGRVAPGSTIVQTAFGGGLTWGTNIMRWGDRIEPIATSDADLPPTDQTVHDLLAPNREFFAPYHHNEHQT